MIRFNAILRGITLFTLLVACGKEIPIEPEKEMTGICKQMELLAGNMVFVEKLRELLSDAKTKNYERGFMVYPSDANGFIYEPVKGNPDKATIVFSPKRQVSGLIHNHYKNLYPVFSATDIKAVYDVYQNEQMYNYTEFFSVVVSAYGAAYMLRIEDLGVFLNFSDKHFASLSAFQTFETRYYEMQQAYSKGNNLVSSFERALYDLLVDSGLALFKSDSPFPGWKKFTSDQYGNLQLTTCNMQ